MLKDMFKTLKKTACAALTAGMILSLAACGKPAAQNNSAQSKGFTPKLDTATECSISVIGHYSNFEALEEEFNRFNKYYPNVKFSYTTLDGYNKNIVAALSGNEAPDIFFTYPWMATNEDCRAVFDIAEDLSDPSSGIDLSCVQDGLLVKKPIGKVQMVPIYNTTYGMMVNEDIFAKEKIEIPKTYDELVKACEALKKAGYKTPVLGFYGSSALIYPLYYPYFCAQVAENDKMTEELNSMKPEAGEHLRSTLKLAADFMSRGFIDLEECAKLENDYNAVILRFFQGDVPIMMASGNTVSGTEKRESASKEFTANPFKYSFRPVPSSDKGGVFLNSTSMGFSVNGKSKNLAMTNEFMRFLISTEELNLIAQNKRMVSPCKDMSLDKIYSAFSDASVKTVYLTDWKLRSEPNEQLKLAAWKVVTGELGVDEAVKAFGTLK